MIKLAPNKNYDASFNELELKHFSDEKVEEILTFQRTHPLYNKTPLVNLPNLAKHLNVRTIQVKDESKRFGLNAFKVLGGIYAIGKYIADRLGKSIEDLSFQALKSKEVQEELGPITFISATDGNHGKGVAWAARELGQKAVIYLPKGSAKTRLEAVLKEGAEGKITDVNYDATVKLCAELAEKNGWVLVQDTAWEGYDEIPLWIMQGYTTIAYEIFEAWKRKEERPTHIFLQAGVGSFAAAITAYFVRQFPDDPPKIVVIEPHQANCYYRSFKSPTGNMEVVTGDLDSIMAGLCCGAPNVRAYRILSQYANAAISCDDTLAALGMRMLGNPLKTDTKIVSGESGAAVGVGLLHYLRTNEKLDFWKALQLNENSSILFINTEGATDKENYLNIVWKGKYSD